MGGPQVYTLGLPGVNDVVQDPDGAWYLPLHVHADPGIWTTCFKTRGGGLWTELLGATLNLVPTPSFFPYVGVAGSVRLRRLLVGCS